MKSTPTAKVERELKSLDRLPVAGSRGTPQRLFGESDLRLARPPK